MSVAPRIARIQSSMVIRTAVSFHVVRKVAWFGSCESHSASRAEGKSVPPVAAQLLSGPSTSKLGARLRSGGVSIGQAWTQKCRMFFTRSR